MKKKPPFQKKHKETTKDWKVTEEEGLLNYLLMQLSGKSRNSVKSILSRGQVFVNGHVTTKHNYNLLPGDSVTVKFGVSTGRTRMVGITILFEDEDIIVVNKEPGILTMATEQEKHMTVYRQLSSHVKREGKKNRLYIVHRLDKDTSGVLMFAKSGQVQRLLQENWRTSVKDRTYIALVEGTVEKEKGTIVSWLKETSTYLMYSSPTPNDGQKAVTHYKIMEKNRQMTLLKINLDTGRKNQIRVHMQDLGHPIVGDKKYGAKGDSAIGRLGLHAHVLSFKHPITGKMHRFESPIPKSFLKPFQ